MQLALFLSVTALLAPAVAKVHNYMLWSGYPQLVPYGPAKIERKENVPLPEPVKFTPDPDSPVAIIPLDDDDIGSKFLLREVEPGKWALLSRNESPGGYMGIRIEDNDITQPFEKQFDLFVYKEDKDAKWVVCENDDFRIYLVMGGRVEQYGPAKILESDSPELPESVGFTLEDRPSAEVALDAPAGGDIGSKFLLRPVAPGQWAFLSRNNGTVPVMTDDITKPFVVDEDYFFYNVVGGFGWVACGTSDFRLYLIESAVADGHEVEGRPCQAIRLLT
ncbi:hypothetical protein F5144DRAFT_624668 [Chaetomium tenue]|uniref:Uncharacterized protein n=1 Tax=Chaetomium tenue TaxID=1854479 RepID=A0ACB7PK47_9PEZI|nr:hypothetical protein F5144DRAFT_624668 [Chaetomium globosum]